MALFSGQGENVISFSNLPKMPDEDKHKYLFVTIDRASRWVYLEVRATKSDYNTSSFLDNLVKKAPFKIKKVPTDNGCEFTDRFQRLDLSSTCNEHISRPELNIQNAGQEKPEIGHRLRQYILILPHQTLKLL